MSDDKLDWLETILSALLVPVIMLLGVCYLIVYALPKYMFVDRALLLRLRTKPGIWFTYSELRKFLGLSRRQARSFIIGNTQLGHGPLECRLREPVVLGRLVRFTGRPVPRLPSPYFGGISILFYEYRYRSNFRRRKKKIYKIKNEAPETLPGSIPI